MIDYVINVPECIHGEPDFFKGQIKSATIIAHVVPRERRKWYMGSGNDHHYRVTCTEDELIILKLKGCIVTTNLTEEHKKKLAEAKVTGLAKLTELEKEALGLN